MRSAARNTTGGKRPQQTQRPGREHEKGTTKKRKPRRSAEARRGIVTPGSRQAAGIADHEEARRREAAGPMLIIDEAQPRTGELITAAGARLRRCSS